MGDLKFFTFAKKETAKLVFWTTKDKSNEEVYQVESGRVIEQIRSLGLVAEERQKIDTGNGNWYCKIDEKDIVYLVLTTGNYPERHAYTMIQKLQSHLAKMGDYSTEDDIALKFHAKAQMNDLMSNFADLKQIDQIAQVQANIQDVQLIVEKDIKKMMSNQADLGQLETKTINMAQASKTFNKQSSELEQIMYWRQVKLNFIICLVVIGILGYILIPIIIEYNKNNSSSSSSTPATTPSASSASASTILIASSSATAVTSSTSVASTPASTVQSIPASTSTTTPPASTTTTASSAVRRQLNQDTSQMDRFYLNYLQKKNAERRNLRRNI